MNTRPTLAEMIRDLATDYGPTLRHEDVAERAAAQMRVVFAVMPRFVVDAPRPWSFDSYLAAARGITEAADATEYPHHQGCPDPTEDHMNCPVPDGKPTVSVVVPEQAAHHRATHGDAMVPAVWILKLLVGGRGVREVRIPSAGYWQVIQKAELVDEGRKAVLLHLAFLVNPDTGYYTYATLEIPVQSLVRVQVDFNA